MTTRQSINKINKAVGIVAILVALSSGLSSLALADHNGRGVVGPGRASLTAPLIVVDVPLYGSVSLDRPLVVKNGQAEWVDFVDVNWRGARRHATMGRLFANGVEVWSGVIPAYDPTFRASVPAFLNPVSHLELRVDSGDAYVNWAKISIRPQATRPTTQPAPWESATGDLDFIGNLTEADELARELVFVISQLQGKMAPMEVQNNLLPLKSAAANVFAVAMGNGELNRSSTLRAVLGLESTFQAQDAFVESLLLRDDTYGLGLTLKTIRQRYKALFGFSTYQLPNGGN